MGLAVNSNTDTHTAANDQARPPPGGHQKRLVAILEGLAYRHDKWQVFSDFVEAGAISVSNAVDWPQRDSREKRYLEIVKRYTREEVSQFPLMLAMLVEALEAGYDDVLGRTFHDLELHNKYKGQFFSPFELCRMMARLTLGDEVSVRAKISERGFVRASEPCCGSGAMIIALAEGMRELGVNYQNHLHVTAVDLDPKCVHMSYLQLSLLHIPAVVIHGNSLNLEEFGHWYTPAHIMGGWNWKLRSSPTDTQMIAPVVKASPDEPHCEAPQKPFTGKPTQLTLF